MSENLPAAAVLKSKIAFSFAKAILPVFNGTEHELCDLNASVLQWWNAPEGTQCLRGITSKLDVITQAILDKDQTVFNFPDHTYADFLVGGTQLNATLNLRFVPVDQTQKQRNVIFTISPNELTIMGINGESFVPVFQKNRIRPLL